MDDRFRGSDEPPEPSRASIDLTYASAQDVRRDRLRDVPRGVMTKVAASVRAGDSVDVRIALVRERAHVSARGLVRWATPLARGSLVGLELEGVEHRDAVKLDVLLGVRVAGSIDEALADGSEPQAPPLSVVMLQPNPVLRQVLQHALETFAKEKAGGADLRLETTADAPSFVAAVSSRHPDLAIIDCDGIADWADPMVEAVRWSEPSNRTPVILLSSVRSPRLEDRRTVTMRKPVAMKSFLRTADLLLGGVR